MDPCILVLALFWHLICNNFQQWCRKCKCVIFVTNLASYYKNDAGTAPSKGAVWEEFNEQQQHQSIKKHYT